MGGKGKKAERKEEAAGEEEGHSKLWYWTVAVIAIGASVAHAKYLMNLFENDRHFSHLADFEREMTYRTEMGLYYSYYKTLITAPTFTAGLHHITQDNVTEYGHTINTLKRFNLYPEVFLSFAYRQFKYVLKLTGQKMEQCWQVNRGGNLPPVSSCEGIENPHYFYINSAFSVAGTVAGFIFLLGVLVSDSLLGGLLSLSAFVFNHGEATRVQWTPPLRETWSYPFILAQITIVTLIIKNGLHGGRWVVVLSLPTVLSMISWQFAQFVYSTQLCAVLLTFSLDFMSRCTFSTLILSHTVSLFFSFLLLFGNEMLLTSMYFPCIIASLAILVLHRLFTRITLRPLFILLNLVIFLSTVILCRQKLQEFLNVQDDAHIGEILRSKFTDFATFNTRLYTCSAEFSFLAQATVERLTHTLLLPFSLAALALSVIFILRSSPLLWRSSHPTVFHLSHIPYHAAQSAAFAVMAVLIMRLKLFMTPHLCISTALLLSVSLLNASLSVRFPAFIRSAFCCALIAAMAYEGVENVKKQLRVHGEYSNVEQEELFEWIEKATPKNAVFAGTMPVMANVKLSTERPIVNHPHYEDEGIRRRTLEVYSIFSKKRMEDVHKRLKKMSVNYIIVQPINCDNHPREECSYRAMWDLHDPTNRGRPSLCEWWTKVYREGRQGADEIVKPFSIAYNRNNYIVLKI